jgi:hypothetical protein
MVDRALLEMTRPPVLGKGDREKDASQGPIQHGHWLLFLFQGIESNSLLPRPLKPLTAGARGFKVKNFFSFYLYSLPPQQGSGD